MMGKRGQGDIGENFAVELLKKNGYEILQRNFRCKLGEIDIIAQEGDSLVFVEVKTRWSRKFGLPQEAVSTRKLSKIKRVGEFYLLNHPEASKKQRIDVVAVEVYKNKVISAKIIKVI